MAKKSDKIVTTRRMAPAGSKTVGKTNGRAKGKPVTSRPVVKPAAARARTVVNLTAVRITAGVVALLCLAGGIAVGVLQGASLTTNTIIELVLLGLIAAAGVFAAVKPEMVSDWVAKLGR